MESYSLNILAERIKKRIAQEWQAQGHTLTGDFESSLSHEIVQNGTVLNIKGNHYGIYMQYGVEAYEIKYPYAEKRIAALKAYAIARMGLDDEMAESVAYAIATKHSIEGMPLPSTRKFSRTGFRTAFVDHSIKDIRQMAKNILIKITKEKIYGDLIS